MRLRPVLWHYPPVADGPAADLLRLFARCCTRPGVRALRSWCSRSIATSSCIASNNMRRYLVMSVFVVNRDGNLLGPAFCAR